jgi:hypothetical protein
MNVRILPSGRQMLSSLFLLLSGVLMTSCMVTSKTSNVDIEAEYVGREGFLLAKPIVVDIKVEKRKIEGSATIENAQYAGRAMAEAKNLAILDAVNRGDADLLVQPMFETQTSATTTTAKVTGYAAKYKEFRNITAADTTSFILRSKMEQSSLIAYATPPTEVSVTQGGKKKSGSAVLAVLGIALLVGLLASGGM